MKIETTFVCEEHEEHGTVGLRPVDMPNADPLGGMAVPHDMLEHFPGDNGGIEAELMALGAMYLLRGETGYMHRNGNKVPTHEHIASDFIEFYRHFISEGFSLDFCEEEPAPDQHADEDLGKAVRSGFALVRDEMDEDDAEDVKTFCTPVHEQRSLNWLRRGYRKAQERYADVDVHTLVYSVFEGIEKDVDTWLQNEGEDNEGTEIVISIDLDELTYTIERTCPYCAGCGSESI